MGCFLPGGMDHGTAGSYRKKKSVILLGLTIRQIELPGFRKRKQTQKRKTQARGNKKLPPPGAA